MDDAFDNWLHGRGSESELDDGRLSPGTVIGAYRIEAFLGKGGFAEVYRARGQDGEHVAIKMLHRLDEQSRLRFERESRILSQIHHPNIPKLLSFGGCGDRPYLVTELLQTTELPHTDKAVARFIKSVCAAADALHKMGYVHRDIKPSNVLWRGDTPVLIDFGLACLKTNVPRPPSTISIVDGQRIVVGTMGYAAPEQFAGGKIDASTDIHAIGMLADACFNSNLSRCWRKIIDRATNSRNSARYATANALARAVTLRHLGIYYALFSSRHYLIPLGSISVTCYRNYQKHVLCGMFVGSGVGVGLVLWGGWIALKYCWQKWFVDAAVVEWFGRHWLLTILCVLWGVLAILSLWVFLRGILKLLSRDIDRVLLIPQSRERSPWLWNLLLFAEWPCIVVAMIGFVLYLLKVRRISAGIMIVGLIILAQCVAFWPGRRHRISRAVCGVVAFAFGVLLVKLFSIIQ